MIILILVLCLAAALVTGCFLKKKVVDEHMLDGPGMEIGRASCRERV